MNFSAPCVSLDAEQFAAAFPFHLVADRRMRLVQAGGSLLRIGADLHLGASLTTLFRALWGQHPLDYASIIGRAGQRVLIEHVASGLTLSGQFVLQHEGELLVFLGSPWLADASDIARLGLQTEDFARHDPAMDLLQRLRASHQSAADSAELVTRMQIEQAALHQQIGDLRKQQSETRKLALIAAHTDNAVILTDVAGRIEWVNEGFCRITGYGQTEAIGHSPGKLLQGPGTNAGTVARIREQLRQGSTFSEEILNYRKDGAPYWIAMEVQPVLGDDGDAAYFMAIERDISAEVATRQRQTLQLDISRLIMDAASLRSGLTGMLRLFCEQLQWSLGQLWAISGDALVLSDSWHAGRDNQRLMQQAGDATLCDPGGALPERAAATLQPAWIDDITMDGAAAHAIPGNDAGLRAGMAFPVLVEGVLWGVLAFYQKQISRPDAMLLQLGTLLGNQAGQLVTRCKAEQDLRLARDKAEAASESKSLFAATLSHEIRTPLNAVIGMGSLLSELPMEDTQRHHLKTILEASDQLLAIINNVLDMSTLDAGRLEAQANDFQLATVLEQVMRISRGLPGAHVLRIEAVVAPGVPDWLRGDAPRLTQVLINLLGNAVKFTGQGSVILSVSRPPGADNRPWLSFTVTDSGRGIPQAVRERIFEPFEQGDIDQRVPKAGTGLGLAICRRIATLLGGTLLLDSTAGAGSSFTFSLPLELGLAPSPQAALTPTSPSEPLRVLVAEDTPASQLVIRAILERLGHSVRVVDDGEQALEAFFEASFDMVFMDIQMPRMDGCAAATAIRKRAGDGRRVPIIGLSAHSREADRLNALAHGMTHFLTKPIKLEDVARLLAAIVQKNSAVDDDDAAAATESIDQAMLAELHDDLSPEGFAVAVRQFQQDTKATLQRLRAMAEAADAQGVGQAAQRLAGLFAQFGATRAAKGFARIQARCEGEQWPSAIEIATATTAAQSTLDAILAVCRALPLQTSRQARKISSGGPR